MAKVTFPTALRRGLGRAFNYVRDYGDTGVEQHILNTIIHDLGYDPQCEGSRGAWLFEMLTYVKDIEPYRRKVIELLGKEASTWDARQHLDIALEFARRGDAEMRCAIYAMFERQEHNESYIGGDQLIALDGLDGLLHVAEIIGRELLARSSTWEDDGMLRTASELYGEDAVQAVMERGAKESIAVRAYLAAVERYRTPSGTRRNITAAAESIEELIERGMRGEPVRHLLRRRGQKAAEEEISHLFEAMLAESDAQRRLLYLRLFSGRAMPRFEPCIIEWGQSSDEALRDAARSAMAYIRHPDTRRFALELLGSTEKRRVEDGLPVLLINFEPEDAELLESLIAGIRSVHTLHSAGLDILNHMEENLDPILIRVPLLLYERTPCSLCRNNVLEYLIALNNADEILLREALSDCYQKTRELAAATLGI